MDDILAKQARIERQDKAKLEPVSIDRHAADMPEYRSGAVFTTDQLYPLPVWCQGALNFNIKRGGILYGTFEEGSGVDFIYEPPQQGSAMNLTLERHTPEEAQVDFLAGLLGYQKPHVLCTCSHTVARQVGWIFSQSKAERDFIMHTGELLQTATMQDELGENAATVLVSWEDNDQGGNVHFEAFQCSEQCVRCECLNKLPMPTATLTSTCGACNRLAKEGWIVPPKDGDEPSGVSKVVNPKEPKVKNAVIVASKDQDEVDNDYFLCPASITSHDGRLHNVYPVENRLLPQGKAELREHMKKMGSASYVERISDFHLLLWLSKQPNLDSNDMILLCDAVKEQKHVMEGYRVIIDSIAGV
eukprot:365252-Chlamydomonas_euryale.AAC.31